MPQVQTHKKKMEHNPGSLSLSVQFIKIIKIKNIQMKRVIPLTLFILGVLTFTASAQEASDRAAIKNSFGIGPRLGYYKAADADEGSFYGGIQARFRPGALIGIEAAVDYRAGQEYAFGNYTLETSSIPVTGSLMLFAPVSESFSPYGLVGIGAYYTRYDYSGSWIRTGTAI